MPEGDFLDRMTAGRDALRRVQRSVARFALSPQQRKSLLDGLSSMAVPGEQMQTMVDMVDAFGPPLAQIEALREELAEQRQQVQEVEKRLIRMEAAAERLAVLGEQLVAFQEPFVHMAEIVTGQQVSRTSQPAPAQESEST